MSDFHPQVSDLDLMLGVNRQILKLQGEGLSRGAAVLQVRREHQEMVEQHPPESVEHRWTKRVVVYLDGVVENAGYEEEEGREQ